MAHEKPGYLSPKELKEGIDLCIENIRDILQECNLLLSNGKVARALALLINAIEEIGKINVLRSINRLPKNK
jgi:AbiV family abortive infection protein